MRVAIIGASGIGKFHGQIFSEQGHEVVAFAGQKQEKLDETRKNLGKLFGFNGKAYTDVKEMIAREDPEIVVVSSPAENHYDHVKLALERSSHVYCEKPFVWNHDLGVEKIMEEGEELLRLSEDRGAFLGLNAQYVQLLRDYEKLRVGKQGNEPIREFYFEMGVNTRGEKGKGRNLLSEIAPHPLSMLARLFPGEKIDGRTIRGSISDTSAKVEFLYGKCKVEIGCANDPLRLSRRFGVNGFYVDASFVKGEDGKPYSALRYNGGELRVPEMMRQSVRVFSDAVLGLDFKYAHRSRNEILSALDSQSAIFSTLRAK